MIECKKSEQPSLFHPDIGTPCTKDIPPSHNPAYFTRHLTQRAFPQATTQPISPDTLHKGHSPKPQPSLFHPDIGTPYTHSPKPQPSLFHPDIGTPYTHSPKPQPSLFHPDIGTPYTKNIPPSHKSVRNGNSTIAYLKPLIAF